MNNTLTLTVPGNPIAKQRSRKGAHGNWYNPQTDIMLVSAYKIKNQLFDDFVMISKGVPIAIEMTFLFNPVKSERGVQEWDPYLKKKDVDNIIKFYLDVMNGIIYYDDNQVFSIKAEKRYTLNEPKTDIEVQW